MRKSACVPFREERRGEEGGGREGQGEEGEGGGGGGAECVCVSEAPEQRRVHTLTHSLRSRTEMVAQ